MHNDKAVPLVSVIVPIYNVKTFIKRGIRQLLQQTYPNVEFLFVDDGSTDGSSGLCEELAARYDNVFAFHKINEGAGSARNLGLDKAHGEYVYFFDIDDEIEPNLISYCVEQMEMRKTDMMVFGFRTVEVEFGNRKCEVSFDECQVDSNKALGEIYVDKLLLIPNGNGFSWNKMYRRSFLEGNKLRFSNLRIQQDEEFNLCVYHHVEHIYISPQCLYTYYIYSEGNTRSQFIQDRFDIYKKVYLSFRELQSYWKLNDWRLEDYLYRRLYVEVIQSLNFNMFHEDCPWSVAQKRHELNRVVSDFDVRKTFDYIKPKFRGFEDKIYIQCYEGRHLMLLYIVVKMFSLARKLTSSCLARKRILIHK